MKISNSVSIRSILYLFIAMIVSLAVGGYCQTKFTPSEKPSLEKQPSTTTQSSTTL